MFRYGAWQFGDYVKFAYMYKIGKTSTATKQQDKLKHKLKWKIHFKYDKE